jgi:hypothetical protein
VSQASLTTSVLEQDLEDDLEPVILPFARRAS